MRQWVVFFVIEPRTCYLVPPLTEYQTGRAEAVGELRTVYSSNSNRDPWHCSRQIAPPFRNEARCLFSEQPEENTQDRADEQTGHDWEIEFEIAFGVVNVSGQSTEPAFADAGPA